ncbi:hypothetical protein [Thermomonospora amylolytica]|nr:hypothetical protein [Thermomonospora amylolytica]
MAEVVEEAAPQPGEACSCGHPAVLVYLLSDGRRVPWCGVTRY